MTPEVDTYIAQSTHWPKEMAALRPILLRAGLEESLKWAKPCYRHEGSNVAIMQEMKNFLALMFFKGVLLEDPDHLLQAQGPNSRSAKRLEFTSVAAIEGQAEAISLLVAHAIDVEDQGLEPEPAPPEKWADELVDRLANDPALRSAFEALTPGRQREYNLYFSGAKQAKTRQARIDKYEAKILNGNGFRDR